MKNKEKPKHYYCVNIEHTSYDSEDTKFFHDVMNLDGIDFIYLTPAKLTQLAKRYVAKKAREGVMARVQIIIDVF